MARFRQGSKPQLFLELAKPNDKGFSRKVSVDEFVGNYEKLKMGNGGDWCRDDGSLGKEYNIRRIPDGNRIVAVRLMGHNKKQVIDKTIPARVRQKLKDQRCRVLATGKVEIDHKDGRRDDPRAPDQLEVDDFQPLSKAANNAKRQHCKECRKTGKRFDATVLGYKIGQVQGNGTYSGTCVGCYWYDIFYFNRKVSEKPTE